MRELQELILKGTQITDAGVAKLKKALSHCKMWWQPSCLQNMPLPTLPLQNMEHRCVARSVISIL
jgi:hypothetical protein